MRSIALVLLICTATAGLCQSTSSAVQASKSHSSPQVALPDSWLGGQQSFVQFGAQPNSVPAPPANPPGNRFLLNPQFPVGLMARNQEPTIFPHAKGMPIPTEWPDAKFEPIPTDWPNLKFLLVNNSSQPQPQPKTKLKLVK